MAMTCSSGMGRWLMAGHLALIHLESTPLNADTSGHRLYLCQSCTVDLYYRACASFGIGTFFVCLQVRQDHLLLFVGSVVFLMHPMRMHFKKQKEDIGDHALTCSWRGFGLSCLSNTCCQKLISPNVATLHDPSLHRLCPCIAAQARAVLLRGADADLFMIVHSQCHCHNIEHCPWLCNCSANPTSMTLCPWAPGCRRIGQLHCFF
jgi:hypothetical protein